VGKQNISQATIQTILINTSMFIILIENRHLSTEHAIMPYDSLGIGNNLDLDF
jgi:hypothetical protein